MGLLSKAGNEVKGIIMKKWNLRRYAYVILWLGLALTVGVVWLFGRGPAKAGKPGESKASSSASAAAPVPAENTLTLPQGEKAGQEGEELAGVWVPYMSLTTEEKTEEAFKENFRSIAEKAKENGINALFVHVRPFCDALYPSKIYPWSHILTGEQGKDPGYDPLEFMVEYTHELGMEFHAWLNPLRVKTAETPAGLSPDNPYMALKEAQPYYFMECEGGVYLDPAYPYVRTLIADGAGEIVENYDVDGIHFDDYFYPGREEELDREAYALYTQSVETALPLPEWRRANISAMVQEVYLRVKKAAPETVFGISPQGNIENDENMGADVRAWCAVPGYLDYICPQLYYSFENPALGYETALEQWLSLPRREGLALYAGLALYKAGTDADEGTWKLSDDTIRRQIEKARERECAGVVLYSSDYLDASQTAEEMENAREALAPALDSQDGY